MTGGFQRADSRLGVGCAIGTEPQDGPLEFAVVGRVKKWSTIANEQTSLNRRRVALREQPSRRSGRTQSGQAEESRSKGRKRSIVRKLQITAARTSMTNRSAEPGGWASDDWSPSSSRLRCCRTPLALRDTRNDDAVRSAQDWSCGPHLLEGSRFATWGNKPADDWFAFTSPLVHAVTRSLALPGVAGSVQEWAIGRVTRQPFWGHLSTKFVNGFHVP